MRIYRLYSSVVFLAVLFVFSTFVAADETVSGKNGSIGYLLSRQLPLRHFSEKQIDDSTASAVFDLYLKQLDFQKRFLLSGDVDRLRVLAPQIDDNLINQTIRLPDEGYLVLSERMVQIEGFVSEIFAAGFDCDRQEIYETDPEKIEYAATLQELKERWRKIIKLQLLNKYLDLVESNAEKTDEQKGEQELFQEAEEKVRKRYKTLFTRLHQETLQDHYDRFFGAVTRAFDPHTNYMAPAKKEDWDIQMRGSLEGIGALLREEDGYIKVVRIIPGSASARQGMLGAEDVILAVAESDAEPVEITDMRIKEAVRLIRGPKGTEVRLTVKKPDGGEMIIPILRDVVQIEETFVKQTIIEKTSGHKFGYIYLPSFYRDFERSRNGGEARNVTEDTRLAIEELKKEKIDGLILDLRDNGGGSLSDAVDVSGLFLDRGPVVQIKNSYGGLQVLEDMDPGMAYGGPVVVLVNQFSASASEIVAAVLQDYNRAVIVGGAHTHGKGTVQTILNLKDDLPLLWFGPRGDELGALKITIQKFYRVNGGSTQYKGVEPDIVLPSLFQHQESGEQYLDYSLPWDQVTPVQYNYYMKDVLKVDQLRLLSYERVADDQEFVTIADEAKKAKIRSEDTLISLQLSDMKVRRDELDKSRDKLSFIYKQNGIEDEESAVDGQNSESEEKSEITEHQKWLDNVNSDSYIREAANILEDFIGLYDN